MPQPSDYGVSDDGRVFDSTLLSQFVVDHPEWVGVGDVGGMSYEAGILAWDQGAPPPSEWESIVVTARGADWWVDVQTIDGDSFTIGVGDLSDIAWDYFDAAGWYDYDTDKDIETE